MSDDLKKALDTAISRIAAMESELSGFRNRKEPDKPAVPAFDANAFRSAMLRDPIGVLKRMGASQDQINHITRVHVAHGLGDEAPQELKMLAGMGPQIDAAHALQTQVQELGRQLTELANGRKNDGVRSSFNALIADKVKYPNLAKALSADPKFVDDDIGKHGGSAEDFAAATEARLAKVAAIYAPPPASTENADTTTGQSTQATPALGSTFSGDPPALPKPVIGAWSADEHAKVRDELVRKYASQS